MASSGLAHWAHRTECHCCHCNHCSFSHRTPYVCFLTAGISHCWSSLLMISSALRPEAMSPHLHPQALVVQTWMNQLNMKQSKLIWNNWQTHSPSFSQFKWTFVSLTLFCPAAVLIKLKLTRRTDNFTIKLNERPHHPGQLLTVITVTAAWDWRVWPGQCGREGHLDGFSISR